MSNTGKKDKTESVFLLTIRWIIFICFLLFSISTIGRVLSKAYYTRHIVIEVTDKAVKDNKYMIYGKTITKDRLPKSYEITDSFLAKRFNLSDLYGDIEIGKTYEMIVGGNRVPFMNWYPNIYEVLPIMVLGDETETEEIGIYD